MTNPQSSPFSTPNPTPSQRPTATPPPRPKTTATPPPRPKSTPPLTPPSSPTPTPTKTQGNGPIVAVVNDLSRSTQTRFVIYGKSFRVGRNPSCDVVLNSPTIADVAFICQKNESSWEISLRGPNRVLLNDEPLSEEPRAIGADAQIRVEPVYDIFFRFPVLTELTETERLGKFKEQTTKFAEQIHVEILDRMRRRFQEVGANVGKIEDARLLEVEKNIEDISRTLGLFDDDEFVDFVAGESVYDRAVQVLTGDDCGLAEIVENDLHYGRLATATPDLERGLTTSAKNILTRIGFNDATSPEEGFRLIEEKFWPFWRSIVSTRVNRDLRNYLALRYFKKTLKDVLFGYGPLEDLLRTPMISEIMVVDYKTIFVEKAGRIENSGRSFFSDEVTQSVIVD